MKRKLSLAFKVVSCQHIEESEVQKQSPILSSAAKAYKALVQDRIRHSNSKPSAISLTISTNGIQET